MRAARANPETRGGGPDGPRMRQGAGMAGAWHGRRIRHRALHHSPEHQRHGQTARRGVNPHPTGSRPRNNNTTGKQHGGHRLPPAKQKARPLQAARSGKSCLFSLDRAGGANALAGTAIDAGSSIDHSLVLHADRADGAGVNTCTASNALAGNGMSHRELLISVLIDVPYRPCTAASRYGCTAGSDPRRVTDSVTHCIKIRKCHILNFFARGTTKRLSPVQGRGLWGRACRPAGRRIPPACRRGGPGSPHWSGLSACRPPRWSPPRCPRRPVCAPRCPPWG